MISEINAIYRRWCEGQAENYGNAPPRERPRTFTGIILASRVLTFWFPDARHQVIDLTDGIAGREVTGGLVSAEAWAGQFELLWS